MSTVKDLTEHYKITISAAIVDRNPNMDDMPDGSLHYKVTLRGFGRRMTLYYSMGPAHTKGPDAAGVLDCLLSDAFAVEYTFTEWCAELGFDPDSRRGERIYKACLKSAEKLRRFLGGTFNEFNEADRG